MKILVLIIILFTAFYSENYFAQGGGSTGASDARSAAMGKTYTITSRGVYSIGRNPANLMFSKDSHFELSTVLPFPNINLRLGTDFISIKDYNYYFGGVDGKGRYLDDAEREKLRELFEGGGFVVTDFSTTILTASYKVNDKIGAFGFGISDRVAFKLNIPSQIIDIAVTGNPIGKVYNFDDTDLKGWWLRDYSFSYARSLKDVFRNNFKEISAGISLKIVQGFAYVGIERFNSKLETGPKGEIIGTGDILGYSSFSDDLGVNYDFDSLSTDKKSNMGLFPSPSGSGFGIDIGMSAQIDDFWSVGFAFTDIGSINWSKNNAKFVSNAAAYIDDITSSEQRDSLVDVLTGKGETTGDFSTPLSTAFRLGFSFQLDKVLDFVPGTLLGAIDYNQGFNNQPRNSTTPRISVGFEWKPANWIPYLRTGFSFGGADVFGWAAGMGMDLGIMEWNFATSDFHYLFMPEQAKRISISFGSRWRF